MTEKYGVVTYRPCSGCCGNENCQEEKEFVLFQHKDKPQCINFMKLRAHEKGTKDITIKSEDEITYRFFWNERIGTVNMRVQEIL